MVGVVFAVLTASIVVVVLSLVGLSKDQAELRDRNVPYAVAIATAALNAKGMANDERGYLISGDREFLEELDQRLINVRTAFAAAATSADGDRQADAAFRAHAAFERWVSAIQAQFETYQAGRREAATKAALGRGRQLRKNYEAMLVDTQSVALTALQRRNNPLASSAWVAILLASLLFVFVLCAVLTLWVARGLPAPAAEDAPELAAEPISEASVRALRRSNR